MILETLKEMLSSLDSDNVEVHMLSSEDLPNGLTDALKSIVEASESGTSSMPCGKDNCDCQEGMPTSIAYYALTERSLPVARKAWNPSTKGTVDEKYIFEGKPSSIRVPKPDNLKKPTHHEYDFAPSIFMYDNGLISPYTLTSEDTLADDWYIVLP